MTAIMIGVGGMGGTIVADVRRQLDRRTNQLGNSPAARQQAAQYRFFLVDTKEEPFSNDFRPNERFVVPSGLDKFYVDEKITNWHASDGRGDEFFAQWWPTLNRIPYRVGDFDEGAGQLRIKGKLAYRMHISAGRSTIVDAVGEAVQSIRNARGISANHDLHKIPVYIVASLGGGTGSGIVLTLAKHLRRRLPTYCVIQGVFLLASIAALAPGKADEASIWANTDAALREIDYFQRAQAHRLDQPSPYLEWPGAGNRIPNREPPFHYIYLFTGYNRETHTLGSISAYTQLVAECLVGETFGAINELIKGPHSQFVARFIEAPDVEERSTSYASVGLAGVRYPTDRIIQHLSRVFGAKVIAQAFQRGSAAAEGVAETEAKTYLQQNGELWEEEPALRVMFQQSLSDEEPFPEPIKLDKNVQFLGATEERIEGIVRDRLRTIDFWKSNELVQFEQKQMERREARFRGDDPASLRAFLAGQFDDRADGVARAIHAIATLEKLVREQIALVEKAIEDPEASAGADEGDGTGLKHAVKRKRQDLEAKIASLKGKPDKKGLEKRTNFAKNWNDYTQTEIDLAVANKALAYYAMMLREIEASRDYLNELITAGETQGQVLDREAKDDLGANIKDSALNVGILDNVAVVNHHFKAVIDQAVREEGGGLIKELINGERGLAYTLNLKIDRRAKVRHEGVFDDFRESIRSSVLRSGRSLFEKAVGELTIWDAIKHECMARRDINEPDDDFIRARMALEHRRADMLRNGTPLVNGDTYLLEQFIQLKLARLKRQAAPFWQLDTAEKSYYDDRPGLLYPLTVLAFDRNVYDDFAAREGLDPDLLDAIAHSVGVAPGHLAGKDAIVLYCREGVAPLFFLGEREKEQLRDSAARISGRNKEIYTDIRLKAVVDPIIGAPDLPEHRRKYALGIMLRQEAATGRLGWTHNGNAPVDFSHPDEIMKELATNAALERELFQTSNAVFEPLSPGEMNDEIEDAIVRARDYQNARPADEEKWWQQVINALTRRLNTSQYRV
jgi:hypothetical protein